MTKSLDKEVDDLSSHHYNKHNKSQKKGKHLLSKNTEEENEKRKKFIRNFHKLEEQFKTLFPIISSNALKEGNKDSGLSRSKVVNIIIK